jgi:hypothetical protein
MFFVTENGKLVVFNTLQNRISLLRTLLFFGWSEYERDASEEKTWQTKSLKKGRI